jgi:hypothetical protein
MRACYASRLWCPYLIAANRKFKSTFALPPRKRPQRPPAGGHTMPSLLPRGAAARQRAPEPGGARHRTAWTCNSGCVEGEDGISNAQGS